MNDTMRSTTHHLVIDGRTIAVEDRGPLDGPVVAFLHSAPGARVLDPDSATTTATGVRLVTIDRPGYGESTPLPDAEIATLTARADDVAAVLGALEIAEAAVVGWSKGGLVALAVAARHPDLVTAVALAGTPAADEEVPWLPDEHRTMLAALRLTPAAARAALREGLAPLAASPEVALASVMGGGADAALLDADGDGPLATRVRAMVAAAFAQGVEGVATDIAAADVSPWGFDLRAVGAPVALFYGTEDEVVTVAHAAHWAAVLPEATRHDVAGAGHLVPLVAWADILRAVAPNH